MLPGTNLSGFAYFKSVVEPTCDATVKSARYSNSGRSADNVVNNQWVCFRAKNSRGIYGYAKMQTDATTPTIVVSQNNQTVTATGDNLSGFAYFKSSSDPNCTYNNTTSTYTNGSSLTNLSDGQWVCFKAKNQNTIWGYAKLKVDLSQTSIGARQTGSQMIGSAFEIEPADAFGESSAIDGNWLIIGAPGDDGASGGNTGAVYILKSNGTNWTLSRKIADRATGFSNLASADWFGDSLAIDGDWLAVGAPGDNGYNGADTGAVYLFQRVGDSWFYRQEISDKSTGFTNLERGDRFGEALSLSGDHLVVGVANDDGYSGTDTGAVYIFKRTGTTWRLEQEISDQKTGFTSLEWTAKFGTSVSLDGDRLVVGSPGSYSRFAGLYSKTGAVYVFARLGTNWHLETIINNDTIGSGFASQGSEFGFSVSLDGDQLAVGSPRSWGSSGIWTGAVFILKRNPK